MTFSEYFLDDSHIFVCVFSVSFSLSHNLSETKIYGFNIHDFFYKVSFKFEFFFVSLTFY